MHELLLVYDYLSFEKEHEAEFYPYTGSYDKLHETKNIVFWTWPGSGESAWILKEEWRNPETDSNFLTAFHAYRDSEGREWGFFGYIYGNRHSWACLSDPGNTDIEAFNRVPAPELRQSNGEIIPPKGFPIQTLIIVLVAGLVIGTGVLIRIFWKPNQNKA